MIQQIFSTANQFNQVKIVANAIELVATFLIERQRFENVDGDVIVAEVRLPTGERVNVKGPSLEDELRKNGQYRFFGKWKPWKNKRTGETEQQFCFSSFATVEPFGREAIVDYLVHHGAGLRLGRSRATKLWELFGEDAVRVTRTDPTLVASALTKAGLYYRDGDAAALSLSLESESATEATKLELTGLLNGRGFPKNIVNQVMEKWGNRAAVIIKRNPYRLMMAGFKNCGFKRCDSMYLDLGLPPGALKRQAICAWHSLARDTEGHTWFSWKVIDAYLRTSIGGAEVKVEKAITLAVRARLIDELRTDGEQGPLSSRGDVRWFAESAKAKNERIIAYCVLRAEQEKPFWPALNGLNLTEHQQLKMSGALASSISILGGSPGTGKTWAVSELIKALDGSVGLGNIQVGAPTGKAAVRVTENLAAKEIELQARTWHSLLMKLASTKDSYFKSKVMAGDETSMNDTDLLAQVMRARPAGTMMLLVGDVNQLPPVGHGAPLRDLIAAGVAYGEFTKIERNSGGIVETCAAIRDQQPWSGGDNLHLVNTSDQHVERIKEVYQQAKDSGLDLIWDVQVVVAVNEKSKLSRQDMNLILQSMLNRQPGVEGMPFRVGDKVVNTKNGFFKSLDFRNEIEVPSLAEEPEKNEREEVYVANGELAKVVSVDRKEMILDLESPKRRVQIYFGDEGGCSFELGYALSVHKSQGSDWPWVIVVLDSYPGAKMVCDRSWLYTAISRAKQQCFLVGQKQVAMQMCKRSKIWHRKTFLKELILKGRAERMLANV
jgi:exodeoxyribonuclease V alpha subunit